MTAPQPSEGQGSADHGLAGQDLDVELLDRAPALAPTLLRGVATGRRRPGAAGTLPTRRLVLTDEEQDARRLADYCRVTGSVLADTVPATWLHVLTFPLQVRLMAGPDFPFPMLGMVHVANEMTLHRPVRVAERLTLSSWSERLEPHRKGRTVDLVGEARVGDEVVWQGRSTYLVRGQGSDEAPARDEVPEVPSTELATWRLPAGLGRSYAAVSGDANPIHLSALSARALGFPRAIAHGMWTHARALAAVQPRIAPAHTVRASFAKPILLPSTVVLRGRATDGGAELAVTSRDASRTHLTLQVGRVGDGFGGA